VERAAFLRAGQLDGDAGLRVDELSRDYRRAQRAIAKRWTTPLRFILVGGKIGDKVIMPTQKMITDHPRSGQQDGFEVGGWSCPSTSGAETYGTEGQVLNTEDKVKEVKEDIIVALGVAKSLVTAMVPTSPPLRLRSRRW
jgi:hypothetical protein